MTTPTPDPWSDDRLDAAFSARATTAEVPPDLVAATTEAVRAASLRPTRPWWRSLPVAAAAAVIVAVVGVGIAISWPTASAPAPTMPSVPPSAPVADSPSPSSSVPVTPEPISTAFGLEIIDVPAALGVRDAGEDDRELAVRGWYSPVDAADCSGRDLVVIRKAECVDQSSVLTRDPESLVNATVGGSITSTTPAGPSVPIALDGIDVEPLPGMPEAGPAVAVEVVLIGHFDDRRSAFCPEDLEQACRDRFVVDRIDTVGGIQQPLSTTHLSEPMEPDRLEIQNRMRAGLPGGEILSIFIGEPHDGLTAWEPDVGTDRLNVDETTMVWVFRVLDGGHAHRYFVAEQPVGVPRPFGRDGEPIAGSTTPKPFRAVVDGRIAVVGRDGVDGDVSCNGFQFPVAGLNASTGAKDEVGPEFDALRAALEDPDLADGLGDTVVEADSWRVAGRTDEGVLFLGTRPRNSDERYWVGVTATRDGGAWTATGGGDCQPMPVIPAGYTWVGWRLDPENGQPGPDWDRVFLQVLETSCVTGVDTVDRLSPAFVLSDPYRIQISLGISDTDGQGCEDPGHSVSSVRVDLPEPLEDRPAIDPLAPDPAGSGG
jgi:hypothetical protein